MNSNIKEYLEMVVKFRKTFQLTTFGSASRSFKYCCMEELVLEQGSIFEVSNLTFKGKRATIKECFRNAAQLAYKDKSLTYCEGIALGIIPVHHAWCVNQAQVVIDPTWKKSITTNPGYYGIPFTTKFLDDATLKAGHYGLLDQPEIGFPLLRTGLPLGAKAF